VSEENEQVANRFHMDIFQEGKLDVADEIVTDDFHWHGGLLRPSGVRAE
jgi:hypothetical protein